MVATSSSWVLGNKISENTLHKLSSTLGTQCYLTPYLNENLDLDQALENITRNLSSDEELNHVVILCDSLPSDEHFNNTAEWLAEVEHHSASILKALQIGIRHLGQCNSDKTITLVTDIFGIGGVANSKAASALSGSIHGMAKSLSKEMSRYDVAINVIAVGELLELGISSRLNSSQEKLVKMTQLGSSVSLAALFSGIGFIQSSGMSMTGQIIRLDGGLLI